MQFIDLSAQQARIKEDIDRRIQAVLSHCGFIMGPEVAELEARLADYVGVKHCLSMASGTDALFAALLALDVGPGDEVVTSAFSFFATAEVIALLGAQPVFVDIDPETYNLDPERLEAAITKKTKAIMPVSLYGQCADFAAINGIAERHGLPVIEDAAQSFGATQGGKLSCNLSTVGCTSFFPSKPLGCYGDGGACFTNDDALADRLRIVRTHGQSRRYHHTAIGFNGRLDTLQAAILLAKMDIFADEVVLRANVGAIYDALLGGRVATPHLRPGNTSVYAQYTIEVADRDEVAKKLNAAGIPTAVHYPSPLPLQPALASLGHKPGDFPHAEAAAARVLSLPMHPYLTRQDQETVAAAVLGTI